MKLWHALSFVFLVALLASCTTADTTTPAPLATALSTAAPATLPPPVVVGGEATVAVPTDVPTADPSMPVVSENGRITEWPADSFGYGIQVHGVAGVGDPSATMNGVRHQLGLDWVKVQIRWSTVYPQLSTEQWFLYDSVIAEAAAHNLRVLVSVVSSPAETRAAGGENGPPDDYNLYAGFLTEMLTRYPGQIHAVEVWNEENLAREWVTAEGFNTDSYVRFLGVAYDAIRAFDPNIIVISGALAPSGGDGWVTAADDFEYLDRALVSGMLDYTDCVGVHHNGYNIGPNVSYDQAPSDPEGQTAVFRGPFDNPHHSWSFKTTLEVYAQKVHAIDPNKKLCVTEFGWASSEGYSVTPKNFEFAQDNTLAEQATYITSAFQQMQQSGDVWIAINFNFDFGNKSGGPDQDPVPYSIIDVNGIPRPAFDAIANMEKVR